MRLRRPKSKKASAADTVASVANVWSEWQLAKRATKGVKKGAKTAGKVKLAQKLTPTRALAALGVAGGVGALLAKRKKKGGGDVSQTYTPPVSATGPVTAAAPPGDAQLDVEAPNESAPGHHPTDEESAGQKQKKG